MFYGDINSALLSLSGIGLIRRSAAARCPRAALAKMNQSELSQWQLNNCYETAL